MLQKALGASRVEQGGPSILLFIFFLKHNTKKLGPRRLPRRPLTLAWAGGSRLRAP